MSEAQNEEQAGVSIPWHLLQITALETQIAKLTAENAALSEINKRQAQHWKDEVAELKQKLLTAGFHKIDKETHINESAQFVKEAAEKIEAQAEEIRTLKSIQAESECIVKGRQERLKEAEFLISLLQVHVSVDALTKDQWTAVGKYVPVSKTPKKDNT